MITCILKGEKINLPDIILKRLNKNWFKNFSSWVYSNLFIKMFEIENVKLTDETKKALMRTIYDVYNKKNLRTIHIIKKNGAWEFKNPKEKEVLEIVNATALKVAKKSIKNGLNWFFYSCSYSFISARTHG